MAESQEYSAVEQVVPLTAPLPELPTDRLPERPAVSDEELRRHAAALAAQWQMAHHSTVKTDHLPERLKSLKTRLDARLTACRAIVNLKELTPQLELLESSRALQGVLQGMTAAAAEFRELPYVTVRGVQRVQGSDAEEAIPRVMNLGEGYLSAADGVWSQESLAAYVGAAQGHDALRLGEVLLLPMALKLAQLEFVLDRADEVFGAAEARPVRELPAIEDSPFSAPLHSLRRLNQFEWPEVLEPLVPFTKVLLADPAGAFGRMEEETRDAYRLRVAELARYADASELEVAEKALALARAAAGRPDSAGGHGHGGHRDPRLQRRLSHVGYYLFEQGLPLLSREIGYHPPMADRMRTLILTNNEEFYILGIFTVSVLLIVAFIAPLVPHHAFAPVIATLFLALLPATQGAADLVNNIVTAGLHPRALPKLDLTSGIPAEEATLVVVPTLLLSEGQVREMFEDLEARYLSNEDPHLHFGLLTDLPDSLARPEPEDRNALVELALRLTNDLNHKYEQVRGGKFLLLHRHRTFNARQGAWMGWERKRGKLLDLNNFILGDFDSFPVKGGPVEVLHRVRYVITLDSDTQLPRGTASRMIGTMAHPLNQAIVDPKSRIVTLGYGILQPRVGVSVSSAARSRLAALYSGETGFDIYTRAVSDVYQDLFGEGIFTGKGIYEVSILHKVLDRRFPRNSLLSHDLIEGAYARAGLVTDIEVIDDYPSHHSAHTRRKHRWVRGDWQIVQWLFGRVPDESGNQVENPISTVSRWKIFDNLRRSLVEPVTFLLLVCGWFFLPGGPVYWTLVTLTLLFLPMLVQLAFNLGRAALKLSTTAAWGGITTFGTSMFFALLNLVFLPHQMLLSLDAIVRSLVRRFVTGKRLLEWETAAQSEAGRKKTSLDRYLQLSPVLALVIAALLFVTHHGQALAVASPILVLWAVAPLAAGWLNASPTRELGPISEADQRFLEDQALSVWRYFADFGGEANHWLIPDNVEEKNTFQVRKLSPTNLGMAFNARQAALELGLLTLPEFAQATLGTLATYERLEKQRGHIYNWYDMETLQPISPKIVSAVDSGNLMASLYALHGGALDLLKRPLLEMQAFVALHRLREAETAALPAELSGKGAEGLRAAVQWLLDLRPFVATGTDAIASRHAQDAEARRMALLGFVTEYAPWLLPRFRSLHDIPAFNDPVHAELPQLGHAGEYGRRLQQRIDAVLTAAKTGSAEHALAMEFATELRAAIERVDRLGWDVARIVDTAELYANAMDYSFLLVESRQLLSIGYDGATGELYSACYDLLASEARIAFFLAVAKGDIPQQSWFRLDRSHVLVNGRAALLSWTGTMFEYLMPALWMRAFPNTLISKTIDAAIAIQRSHTKGMPWGISESGFGAMDPNGRYGYQAFGIPQLALKYGAEDGPVISPYSTFLTLPFARKEAIANLRRMAGMGWTGVYGLYEAADYTAGASEPVMVRSWMAHHQGMSLLALTNLLSHDVFQRWFHANPRVRAAELLLHERPLAKETLKALAKQPSPTQAPEAA